MAETVSGDINVRIIAEELGGGPGVGGGVPSIPGAGGGAKETPASRKTVGIFRDMKGLLGIIGGALTIGAMFKHSKIMSSTLTALFDIMGALVDLFLMPFIPLLIPLLKGLGKLVAWVARFMQDPTAALKEVWDGFIAFLQSSWDLGKIFEFVTVDNILRVIFGGIGLSAMIAGPMVLAHLFGKASSIVASMILTHIFGSAAAGIAGGVAGGAVTGGAGAAAGGAGAAGKAVVTGAGGAGTAVAAGGAGAAGILAILAPAVIFGAGAAAAIALKYWLHGEEMDIAAARQYTEGLAWARSQAGLEPYEPFVKGTTMAQVEYAEFSNSIPDSQYWANLARPRDDIGISLADLAIQQAVRDGMIEALTDPRVTGRVLDQESMISEGRRRRMTPDEWRAAGQPQQGWTTLP